MFPVYLLTAPSCSGMVGFAAAPNPIVHSAHWEPDLPATHTGMGFRVEMWAEKEGLPRQTLFVGNRKLKHRRKAFNCAPQTLRSMKWVETEERPDQHGWAAAGKSKALRRSWARWPLQISSILNDPSVQHSSIISWEGSVKNCFLFFHENTPSAAMHNSVWITPAPLSSRCGCRHCLHSVFISIFQLWGCPRDAK